MAIRVTVRYEGLKAELSTLTASCHPSDSNPYNAYNERGGAVAYEYDRPTGGDMQHAHQRGQLSSALKRTTRRLSLRAVAIFILASLRLTRILRNVRSQEGSPKKVQQSFKSKKIMRKMPQSTYHQLLARKFGNKISIGTDHSLLDLISSDREDKRRALRYSEGSKNIRNNGSGVRGEAMGAGGSAGGEGSGGREGDRDIVVLRDTLCSMSEAIAGLRAKELLLYVSTEDVRML